MMMRLETSSSKVLNCTVLITLPTTTGILSVFLFEGRLDSSSSNVFLVPNMLSPYGGGLVQRVLLPQAQRMVIERRIHFIRNLGKKRKVSEVNLPGRFSF